MLQTCVSIAFFATISVRGLVITPNTKKWNFSNNTRQWPWKLINLWINDTTAIVIDFFYYPHL